MTVVTEKKTIKGNGRYHTTTTRQTAVSRPQSMPAIPSRVWLWPLIIGALLTSSLLIWQGRTYLLELGQLLSDQVFVSTYIRQQGMWGPFVLALGQLLQVLIAFIPGHVLLIAAGYVYGFTGGFLLNLLCVVAASQIAFLLARWWGRPFIHRFVSPTLLERWYTLSARQGFLFFTICFVLPVFPTDMMNFVAGLSGISGRKFLAANLLGRMPGILMLTLIGSHGLSFARSTWIGLGVLVAAVYVMGRFTLQRIERRYQEGQSGG